MTDKEVKDRKVRVANRKFMRDAADFLFRVVQMWIVLALALYFQRQTASTLATVVMLVLSGALFVYCYAAPMYLVEDWEIGRGKELHGLIYLAALIGTALVAFPLLFADPIVDEMNRITHTSGASPAFHTPGK